MATNVNTDLLLKVDYAKSMPGNCVPDAFFEEFISRLKVSALFPEAFLPSICLADDPENLLQKQQNGCLRVQTASFHREQIDVPVPNPVIGPGEVYFVPGGAFRIKSVVLANGTIVPIPNEGQTFEDPDYVYPANLAEFVDNLNGEAAPFTWAVESDSLTVTSDTGAEIIAVIQGGELEEDPTSYSAVTVIESEQPGDTTVIFQAANVEKGIDYQSAFAVIPQIIPGDAFEKAWITEIENESVTVKITGVSKVLSAELLVFTFASPETTENT